MPCNEQTVEILLVEDSPTDAELTINALRESNMANQVVWVKDGVAALDYVFRRGAYAERPADNAPHLIVLDLQMPKLNGIEVLRALKGDARSRHIPVVVLTSSQLERDVKECYQLGVNSFVSKPVEFAAFAKAVSQLGLYWMLLNRVAG